MTEEHFNLVKKVVLGVTSPIALGPEIITSGANRSWPVKLAARMVGKALRKVGARAYQSVTQHTIEAGEAWPSTAYTMVGRARIDALCQAVKSLTASDPVIVECGVWRGGSVIMARAALDCYKEKRGVVHAFDSFGAGFPVSDHPLDRVDDWTAMDHCVVTEEEFWRNVYAILGSNHGHIFAHKGFFAPGMGKNIAKVDVLRLDGDMHVSTKICLDEFLHKVVPGGVVIIDDYFSVPACKQACDEHEMFTEMVKQHKERTGSKYFCPDKHSIQLRNYLDL